jgi:hypothetical protein
MQLPLTNHLPLASSSQQELTRRLLPLYIAAFSQGLVLWAPIEKVFLKSLGFDQASFSISNASQIASSCFARNTEPLSVMSAFGAPKRSTAAYRTIKTQAKSCR